MLDPVAVCEQSYVPRAPSQDNAQVASLKLWVTQCFALTPAVPPHRWRVGSVPGPNSCELLARVLYMHLDWAHHSLPSRHASRETITRCINRGSGESKSKSKNNSSDYNTQESRIGRGTLVESCVATTQQVMIKLKRSRTGGMLHQMVHFIEAEG